MTGSSVLNPPLAQTCASVVLPSLVLSFSSAEVKQNIVDQLHVPLPCIIIIQKRISNPHLSATVKHASNTKSYWNTSKNAKG